MMSSCIQIKAGLGFALFGLSLIVGSYGQVDPPVIARVGDVVNIAINIPNVQSPLVYIPMVNEEGLIKPAVLLYMLGFRAELIDDDLTSTLQVSTESSTRSLTITILNVQERFAGDIGCWDSPNFDVEKMDNCGRRLIVLGKPSKPLISKHSASSALVGGSLVLSCETRSTTLPADHGLSSIISWMDSGGNILDHTSQGFYVNAMSELQKYRIERSDEGQEFTCTSAEDVRDLYNGNTDDLISPPSIPYAIRPEYAPSQEDVSITPNVAAGATISVEINEKLEYTCSADCNPACTITWAYKSLDELARYEQIGNLADPAVLLIDSVKRLNRGYYRCRAGNVHSEEKVKYTFEVDVVYLQMLNNTMNGKYVSNASVWEMEEPMTLQCLFDANPGPKVTWKSPQDEVLLVEDAAGPQIHTDLSGARQEVYTSTLQMGVLTCEDSGIVTCHGVNDVVPNVIEGRLNVNVKCSPSPATVPDMTLQEEYVWELGQPLKVEFVIRGWPSPTISRITSSHVNDDRLEEIGTDFEVIKATNHDNKKWLTKFTMTSRRALTMADAGREITMVFSTSYDNKPLSFKINPRGPPHEVKNLTIESVTHYSADVFWMPNFDGGETQRFLVMYRRVEEDRQDSSSWTMAVKDVPENANGNWVEVTVTGLSASTQYEIQVMAQNMLGNSTSVTRLETAGAPSGGLSAGAIFGIVFAIIVFLIIVVFLVYWFVLRKRGYKIEKVDSNFKRIQKGVTESVRRLTPAKDGRATQNGDVANNQSKKNPIMKMKAFFNRPPKKSEPDYDVVPGHEQGDDTDNDSDFDEDYVNTDQVAPPHKEETVYANATAIKKHEEDKKKNLGRTVNEDGLVYVSVDHTTSNNSPNRQNNNNNNNNFAATATTIPENPKEDSVDYSEIDFSKVPMKVTAEVNPMVKHDNGNAEAAAEDDGNDAADGGAEVRHAPVQPAEASFGTAV